AQEIGNPLNSLHIHLQLMERELNKMNVAGERPAARGTKSRAQTFSAADAAESTRKLERYLEVARGEIDRLDYIVTQFLQAIRPSPPQMKPASLNDVLSKTGELLRPELDNRGLNVKTRLDSRLPLAPLDATQIQQALVNLIKNAMQAMTKGGTLTLQTGQGSDGVWVSV